MKNEKKEIRIVPLLPEVTRSTPGLLICRNNAGKRLGIDKVRHERFFPFHDFTSIVFHKGWNV